MPEIIIIYNLANHGIIIKKLGGKCLIGRMSKSFLGFEGSSSYIHRYLYII